MTAKFIFKYSQKFQHLSQTYLCSTQYPHNIKISPRDGTQTNNGTSLFAFTDLSSTFILFAMKSYLKAQTFFHQRSTIILTSIDDALYGFRICLRSKTMIYRSCISHLFNKKWI